MVWYIVHYYSRIIRTSVHVYYVQNVRAFFLGKVDFLQQSNRELESKLNDAESANKELGGRVQELSGKNAKICEGQKNVSMQVL